MHAVNDAVIAFTIAVSAFRLADEWIFRSLILCHHHLILTLEQLEECFPFLPVDMHEERRTTHDEDERIDVLQTSLSGIP